MIHLNSVLHKILEDRYMKNIISEQVVEIPTIRELPIPGTSSRFAYPKSKVTEFLPPIRVSEIPFETSIPPVEAESIIANEIRAGLSKTRNPEELVSFVYERQPKLFSDPSYGDRLATYTANKIKDTLGQKTEEKPYLAPPTPLEIPISSTGVEPLPYEVSPKMVQAKPETLLQLSTLPKLQALLKSAQNIKKKTATEIPREEEEEESKPDYSISDEPIRQKSPKDQYEYGFSSDKSDVDLEAGRKLGKYASTYRVK